MGVDSKFIGGSSPFDGFEDYFDSKEIKVSNKFLNYPIQLKLFSGGSPEFGLRVKSGYFYELLSHGIYGGKVKSQNELENEIKSTIISEPDISDESSYREIKSIRYYGDLQLCDDQMAKYCLLQTGKYSQKKRINFIIFRHGIKNMHKNFMNKGLDSLIDSLSNSTKSMMYLPFRVVFDLYTSENIPRYDGQRYLTMSRIYAKKLKDIFKNPQETLEKLGVDMEGLDFYKRKFPLGVNVSGFEVNPFPVLIVRDKRSQTWDKKFDEFMKSKAKHSMIFNETVQSFLNGDLNDNFSDEVNGEDSLSAPF